MTTNNNTQVHGEEPVTPYQLEWDVGRTRVSIDRSAGLVSGSRGIGVGEPPLELADVGARALDVEQVAGLADAVQEAVVAQLPAMSLDRSCMVN